MVPIELQSPVHAPGVEMTFTDPAIEDVASLIHGTCPRGRGCSRRDHLPLARYVVSYFTTTNTERRISEAHSLGIKAGSYATAKTIEKLQSAVEQLQGERDRLAAKLANADGRRRAAS